MSQFNPLWLLLLAVPLLCLSAWAALLPGASLSPASAAMPAASAAATPATTALRPLRFQIGIFRTGDTDIPIHLTIRRIIQKAASTPFRGARRWDERVLETDAQGHIGLAPHDKHIIRLGYIEVHCYYNTNLPACKPSLRKIFIYFFR